MVSQDPCTRTIKSIVEFQVILDGFQSIDAVITCLWDVFGGLAKRMQSLEEVGCFVAIAVAVHDAGVLILM